MLAHDEQVGRLFGGKYRVDKLIAKGGMGRVYRGTQFPLERAVAIKILNKEFQASDPQFVRRFFLEAATAARLSHPHSITVFDYGETETGDLFIAMEYLRGRPLSRVITQDGPFGAQRALRIGVQICRALREAHALGIIHRDLKPGNIFLVEEGDQDQDYAKVLDFGLVKLFRAEDVQGAAAKPGILGDGDPDLTRTGTLLGSPKYMSPEQIQGYPLDPRTDIYSFGVILFQMIAGKPPYSGATGVDVIYKHVHAPIPSIASVSPEVLCPAPVEALITRCLQKRREDRYASMDVLIAALKEALHMLGAKAVSVDSVAELDSELQLHALRNRGLETLPAGAEANFKDGALTEDATPLGQKSGDLHPKKPSRVPLALAAAGFAVAVAALVFVTVPRSEEQTAEVQIDPRTPAAAPAVEIFFASEPAGAEVFEGATLIGVTPFRRKLQLAAGEDRRELLFRREGYRDEVKTVRLDGSASRIDATLSAREEPIAAEDSDGDEREEDRRGSSKKRRASTPKTAKKESTPSYYRQNPY